MLNRIVGTITPIAAALALGLVATPASSQNAPKLTDQTSGTTALLQAVSPVNGQVVWVSGHHATYARTLDGGATWEAGQVPGPDTLQFRDVHAVTAEVAYLLAAGPGEMSRIYKTTDGGKRWTLQFQNENPDAFYDCFDFWDQRTGVAFSDAVNGRFIILRTEDGGVTWTPLPDAAVPPATPGGEGSFAASGTCVLARGQRSGWIGTGAGAARMLLTTNRGHTWTVAPTPIVAGEFAGIATLAFRDTLHGAALGGDLADPDGFSDNVAVTDDGGRTWRLAGRPTFPGPVYGSGYVPGTSTIVAVGPNGMAFSRDDGATWTTLETRTFWAVGFAEDGTGWATGPEGSIVRLDGFR